MSSWPFLVLEALLLLAVGAVAGYLLRLRSRESFVPPMPIESHPPPFDPSTIKRLPPVKLEPGTIESFVLWVAGTPMSKVQEVRDAIADARADDKVAGKLIATLFELPATDIGRHQMLLSIIGEMARPEFFEPLVRFIELPDDDIMRYVGDAPPCGVCTTQIIPAALLKGRAVEMLAHLRTTEALEAVLGFASKHESRVVRLAALDAYTYNHDDNPESLARAAAAARPEEAKFVGLPRRTRDMDPEKFEASVDAFYKRYPEELPPAPQMARQHAHRHGPRSRTQR